MSTRSEELHRQSSLLKVPFLVRFLVNFSTAFFLKRNLCQLIYNVSVNYAVALHLYGVLELHVKTFCKVKTSTKITLHVLLFSGIS
jgi:hypothetical protein